uniref:Uncharacterized protein n=1 Tax=Oryza brachyantha TaxID=4533 RepID=J3MRH5_ORYBR
MRQAPAPDVEAGHIYIPVAREGEGEGEEEEQQQEEEALPLRRKAGDELAKSGDERTVRPPEFIREKNPRSALPPPLAEDVARARAGGEHITDKFKGVNRLNLTVSTLTDALECVWFQGQDGLEQS